MWYVFYMSTYCQKHTEEKRSKQANFLPRRPTFCRQILLLTFFKALIDAHADGTLNKPFSRRWEDETLPEAGNSYVFFYIFFFSQGPDSASDLVFKNLMKLLCKNQAPDGKSGPEALRRFECAGEEEYFLFFTSFWSGVGLGNVNEHCLYPA